MEQILDDDELNVVLLFLSSGSKVFRGLGGGVLFAVKVGSSGDGGEEIIA